MDSLSPTRLRAIGIQAPPNARIPQLLGVARRAGAQHDALGVAHQLECRISGRAGSDGVRLSIELHDSRFAVFESEMAERR